MDRLLGLKVKWKSRKRKLWAVVLIYINCPGTRMVSWDGNKKQLNTEPLPAGCFASESNAALAPNKPAHISPNHFVLQTNTIISDFT